MYQVIRLAHALGYVEFALQSYRQKLKHAAAEYLDQRGEMSDQINSIIKSHLAELEDLENYISVSVDTIAGDK